MSLGKTVTMQVAQRRKRPRQELIARKDALSKQGLGPTFTIVQGPDTGCSPCGEERVGECPGCEETFNRFVPVNTGPNGWGTSEFGSDWLNSLDTSWWVTGSEAGANLIQTQDFAVIEDLPLSYPFDVIIDFRVLRIGPLSGVASSALRVEFTTSPFASSLWQLSLSIDPSENWALGLRMDNCNSDSTPGYKQAAILTSDEWNGIDLVARIRAADGYLRAKVWSKYADQDTLELAEEPLEWQVYEFNRRDCAIETPTALRLRFFTEYTGGGDDWYWTFSNIKFLEGCSTGTTTQPYCLDTFSRSTTAGFYGTADCGLEYTVTGPNELGAYVSSVGHIESVMDGGFLSGPKITLAVSPPDSNVWQARLTLKCIAEGKGGILYFLLGSGTRTSGDVVDFVLPNDSIPEKLRVSHRNTSGPPSGQQVNFSFINGHEYELLIILTDGSTTASIRDLETGVITTASAGGTAVPAHNFEMGEYISFVSGALAAHFTVDDLRLSYGDTVSTVDEGGDCINSRDIIDQSGSISGAIDTQQTYNSSNIADSAILVGRCSRISSVVYKLPSDAGRVQSVTIDGIPASGWTFTAPRTITLAAPIVELQTLVVARYYAL